MVSKNKPTDYHTHKFNKEPVYGCVFSSNSKLLRSKIDYGDDGVT